VAVTEPALWGVRRRLLDLANTLHVARPAVRAYELALAAKSRLAGRDRRDDDGLPLPPASLRAQAGPRHADAGFFLRSGRMHAELVQEVLRENAASVEDCEAILDWGCGCGRVLRHWSRLSGPRFSGCDINPKMVAWCRANLPFADVTLNDVAPPLPYADSSFDLVYAFSVITHLPDDLQREWMRECLRILAPGGFLLVSTLGEYYLSRQRLTESERESFLSGNVVVLYEQSPGTSLCSAYHPPQYVHGTLARGFEVAAFRPAADEGRHDIHLLRRPARTAAPVRQP
jgi:SAM-dependent methyltransferase